MQLSSFAATPVATPAPPATSPAAVGGTQGFVANVLRGAGAGYHAATNAAGTQADKGAIYPIESVYTGVSLLADKTKNIKGVSTATGLLKKVSTFGLLILGMQASSMLKSPGATAMDLTHGLADMIDGQKTRTGFNLGFGVDTGDGEGEATAPKSGIGSMLAGLGVGDAPRG